MVPPEGVWSRPGGRAGKWEGGNQQQSTQGQRGGRTQIYAAAPAPSCGVVPETLTPPVSSLAGAEGTQMRVVRADGRKPVGVRRSGDKGMWAWLGVGGAEQGLTTWAGRKDSCPLSREAGWTPARLDGLRTLPWVSLHLTQGSSESWSPGRCLWGLASTDSKSLFLSTPTFVRWWPPCENWEDKFSRQSH